MTHAESLVTCGSEQRARRSGGRGGAVWSAFPNVRRIRPRSVWASRGARAFVLFGVVSFASASCAAPRTTAHSVVIRGFEYLKETVTVQRGDTVTWTNEDLVPHTATATAKGFDSGAIESKAAWRFVAVRPGAYAYVCAFHPSMRGALIVR